MSSQRDSTDNAATRGSPLDQAMLYLGEGREREAREILAEILETNPRQPRAQNLLSQIEDDPQVLLGDDFQTYKVQPGDTMSELAERFAGDSFLFYALSRYNNLASPMHLTGGAVIKVPVRKSDNTTLQYQPALRENSSNDLPSAASPAPISAGDLRAAADLRRDALKMLNAGDVENAVKALRHARQLAPDDPMITSDLSRAERLLTAVKTRG
ncbi:LysM peptidoglycan-binding domain-containing protein [Hyphococcus sp.]|uniref:LysM peptidoglycan-binding domain-containing protein n=1 Tax=Hyphococcus sp. TaxID=2038636 RepID=UPI003CCB7AD8